MKILYTNDILGRRTSKNDELYGYNVRDELTSADEVSYNYNDIGNRTTAEDMTYTANNLNQYTAINDFIQRYDADGNQTVLLSNGRIWDVTYNAENRPVRWTQGDTLITMAFDALGRRIRCMEKNGDTLISHRRFVYRGYLCVAEFNGENPTQILKTYVWDPTEPTATRPLRMCIEQEGQTWFYMHDGNKNVTDIICQDIEENIVIHYNYGVFGECIALISNAKRLRVSDLNFNSYCYSSEYLDDGLGLVYYNHRHYNPMNGRWMSRDPITFTAPIKSLYGFLDNNPISRYDHLGLANKCCCGGKSMNSMRYCCVKGQQVKESVCRITIYFGDEADFKRTNTVANYESQSGVPGGSTRISYVSCNAKETNKLIPKELQYENKLRSTKKLISSPVSIDENGNLIDLADPKYASVRHAILEELVAARKEAQRLTDSDRGACCSKVELYLFPVCDNAKVTLKTLGFHVGKQSGKDKWERTPLKTSDWCKKRGGTWGK